MGDEKLPSVDKIEHAKRLTKWFADTAVDTGKAVVNSVPEYLFALAEKHAPQLLELSEDFVPSVRPFLSHFRKQKIMRNVNAVSGALEHCEEYGSVLRDALEDSGGNPFIAEVVEELLDVSEPVHAALLLWIGARATKEQSHPFDRMLFTNIKSFGMEDFLALSMLVRHAKSERISNDRPVLCASNIPMDQSRIEKFITFGIAGRSGRIDGNLSGREIDVVLTDYARELGEMIAKTYPEELTEFEAKRTITNAETLNNQQGF